jgi:hypothetical protein
MAFTFTLEHADGTPADPPTFTTVAPSWKPGDTIPLGRRALRVIGVRVTEVDEPAMLIVEDVSRMSPPSEPSRQKLSRGN